MIPTLKSLGWLWLWMNAGNVGAEALGGQDWRDAISVSINITGVLVVVWGTHHLSRQKRAHISKLIADSEALLGKMKP